jgi:hypothetical protein
MSGALPVSYQLSTLRPAMDTIKDWLAQAAAQGIRPLLEAALRRNVDRLKNDPINWGNPLFTYRHLGMTMYIAVEWDIVVTYGVDVTHQLVCIQRFHLLPANPLKAPPPGGATP